jgi:hypothetical protein
MIYFRANFQIPATNSSLVFAILSTAAQFCCLTFYKKKYFNESLIFYEDLLPYAISGTYVMRC